VRREETNACVVAVRNTSRRQTACVVSHTPSPTSSPWVQQQRAARAEGRRTRLLHLRRTRKTEAARAEWVTRMRQRRTRPAAGTRQLRGRHM
jgi:hypothetical protein